MIMRMLAHAKFNKPKTQTMTQKPEIDGFQTKIAKDGRDKGYSLGLQDYENYVDYDNLGIQSAFEKALTNYIEQNCPTYLDDVKKVWWSNGFVKGYESGVNAPIKKLNCGKENGTKFVEEVKKKFGSNIIWKEETKKAITSFVHNYLNEENNIPKEYKGALYKRWYCDSFKRAVKDELSPKIKYEKGNSVEDADNVMKHILARLFEFLYISVYRETTFQEIFSNANPDILF